MSLRVSKAMTTSLHRKELVGARYTRRQVMAIQDITDKGGVRIGKTSKKLASICCP
jgi:hypothetical protein